MMNPAAEFNAGWDDILPDTEQASRQYEADWFTPEVIGKKRPCAWVRKNEHRKKLKRKYRIMHHWGNSQAKKGIQLQNIIYVDCDDTDWRTHGFINYHQHLYLSSRGDIRVIHGSITAYPHVFTPTPTYVKKFHAVQANRRIRHMRISEDSSLNYGWLKKKCTCFDDGL